MKDTPKHQGMRRKLVELLEQKGIRDKRVLQALLKVPRHYFFESSFLDHAYEDKAFPIAAGQTISQPFTVAFQSELLNTKPSMKVLEIGTGSGYQAAVLAEMQCKVYTIERQKELFDRSKLFLSKNYSAVRSFYGDGYKGLPQYAPYERIIVTAGAGEVPQALLDQLAAGGILVIPVGVDDMDMLRLTKQADGSFAEERFPGFRFVPLLKDKA
jgi:protein-L-isoaspartate(D-aspartate) O-methyltransferase